MPLYYRKKKRYSYWNQTSDEYYSDSDSYSVDEDLANHKVYSDSKYEDVRTEMYKKLVKESIKHNNVATSVGHWMTKIREDGGKGRFSGNPELYLFAWCTRHQLEVMNNTSLVACMSSKRLNLKPLSPRKGRKVEGDNETHAYLFTIQVKDWVEGKGIPIAYMLCPLESLMRVQAFKIRGGLLKAAEKDWKEMKLLLRRVLHSESREQLDSSWATFKDHFPVDVTGGFINYMETTWLTDEKRPLWVNYLRGDYEKINTSYLWEVFFGILKNYHLEKPDIRADFVIGMLQGEINDYFRDQGLTKFFKFTIRSFESRDEYYIDMDEKKRYLSSCSCPDYKKNYTTCKHMYLVNMVYPDVLLKWPPLPKRPSSDLPLDFDHDFGSPLESIIVPHLLHEQKAEKEDEKQPKKRKREEGTDQALQECENELQDLWERMGRIVHSPGKSRCTLEDLQDAVATLRASIVKAEARLRDGSKRRVKLEKTS
ncbi:hypothetical protein BGX31_001277 [Mortierella sp. GBA43]|nr:hypothetical protein BGX31_001277 [Mortierella sp. GBA43]